jgi:hypothetical protein
MMEPFDSPDSLYAFGLPCAQELLCGHNSSPVEPSVCEGILLLQYRCEISLVIFSLTS